MRTVLVSQFGKPCSVPRGIGQHDGEGDPVVHAFLEDLAGEAAAQVEELGCEVFFCEADADRIRGEPVPDVVKRTDGGELRAQPYSSCRRHH